MTNSAVWPCTKEKWGNLSDEVSSGKSPDGQELVNQDTSKRLLDRSNQRPHDFGPVLLSMSRHSQWKNKEIVLTATKMNDSSCSTNKMIFQTCAQTYPTSLEITHWHSFPIGTHHLTFFLSTSWRVATGHLCTSKKGLLGSVRFHTFSCARGHHDPIGGPKNDLWARKVQGIPGIPAYGARWLCRKTLNKMVENQLMLTSRDL